jgi:cytochrome c biogenesis protein ResB
MNGKYLATSVLRSLFLGALVLTWSGCSLPQKAEDDAKAKADAERQKEDERKRLEAEIRAKLEKEVAEKQKKAAAEGTKKKIGRAHV